MARTRQGLAGAAPPRRGSIAAALLAVAVAAGSAAFATADGGPAPRSPSGAQLPSAPLGDEARCARYAGLPPRWGQDPRAGMVRVAAGDFDFGSTRGYADERPAAPGARTRVAAFWIDRTEVTIAQFAAFVRATGYVTEAERQGGAVVFRTPRPSSWRRGRSPGGPGCRARTGATPAGRAAASRGWTTCP